MKNGFYKADLKVTVEDKEITFSVIHNLPPRKGLSFENAFESWLTRTETFTPTSLCGYIMGKNTGYICFTEEDWNKLMEK